MLVWSTILPLKAATTLDEIYWVFKLWLDGSPHSRVKKDNVLPDQLGNGMSHFETVGEKIDACRNGTALGLRYIKAEGEVSWRTEMAFCRSMGVVASTIRIFVDTNGVSYKKPHVKTPYIVKQLSAYCGFEDDGPFRSSPRARQLRSSDAGVIAGLIRGTVSTMMPVVYLQPSYDWSRDDLPLLEKWIGGRAHIVYSPNRTFEIKVAELANNPAYPTGSITVFIPQSRHPVTLPVYRFVSIRRMMASAAIAVRDAMLNATGTLGLSYEMIVANYSRGLYDKLKKDFASKSTENQEFVNYADGEITAQQEKIAELQNRVEFLQNEIERLRAKSAGHASIDLRLGETQPYYVDEVRDAILQTLSHGVKNLNADGRYCRLVADILAMNPTSEFKQRVSDALEKSFMGNKHVQRGDFAPLERLGFCYLAGNKHHQMAFHGDQKLMFTVAKTPSDHCSAANGIHDVLKRLFQ